MTFIFNKIVSIFLSAIFSVLPFLCYSPKDADNIRLNAAIISDTHIDVRLPLGQCILKKAFKDMNMSSVKNDAVIALGDLTNYGDAASVEKFFEIMTSTCNCKNAVIASGNHDIGHAEVTNEEARQQFINTYNKYTNSDIQNIYYSKDVNGYTFIVMGDQSEDNWDKPIILDDQLEFIDSELARATADGKPAFVLSHAPISGVNGQSTVWENGSMDDGYNEKVQAILEKYSNVFFISGHMHKGLNNMSYAPTFETKNGVHYLSVPTYLLVNQYGWPCSGTGFQLEVYDKEVVFRARSYEFSHWDSAYQYIVELT